MDNSCWQKCVWQHRLWLRRRRLLLEAGRRRRSARPPCPATHACPPRDCAKRATTTCLRNGLALDSWRDRGFSRKALIRNNPFLIIGLQRLDISRRISCSRRPAMALRALRYTNARCAKLGTRLADHKSSVPQVAVAGNSHDRIRVDDFRHRAFDTETPLCMKAAQGTPGPESLPAIRKWFQPPEGDVNVMRPSRLAAASYLDNFSMTLLPYELLYPQRRPGGGEAVRHFIDNLESLDSTVAKALGKHLSNQLSASAERPGQEPQLLRFHAPLALLLAALDSNRRIDQSPANKARGLSQKQPLRGLYVAQAPINDLPEELRNDLPAGDIVKYAGRGDVYDSSIWLGLEPTYTPLHRDPNPNLFVQLCSTKVVRLLPPASGDLIFHCIQQTLGRSSGNSRIRGAEMMQGLERQAFYNAVWERAEEQPGWQPGGDMPALPMQEATLDPSDALYIPKGWWHSVKSMSSDGRLNGSVNWWFR